MIARTTDVQTSDVRGTGYYVHYKVNGKWLVDGPYGDDYVTDNKNGHLKMSGCTDAYVSDRSFCERKDDA